MGHEDPCASPDSLPPRSSSRRSAAPRPLRRRSAPARRPARPPLPTCNLTALANHKGLVNITFWNSASEANPTTLQGITNAFNASQSKVHVTLVTQASYDDTWQKYEAGLSNGQLPDAVQLEDQRTQAAIDTGSFLPVQSCMNAAHYPTTDYLPRPLAYWKVNGVQWALPFAVSAPILYYNQNAFTKAGLNPSRPPATLAQMVADAKALKASGSGMGLVLDPWHLETWLATANQLFVNNNNGRSGRATKAAFNNKTAVSHLQPARHAGALGRRHHQPVHRARPVRQPARHRQRQVRHDHRDLGRPRHGDPAPRQRQVRQCEARHRRLPRLSSSIKGGIEPGGSGVYISNKVPALDQAASWEFLPTSEHPEPGHLGGRHRATSRCASPRPRRRRCSTCGPPTPATRWPTTRSTTGPTRRPPRARSSAPTPTSAPTSSTPRSPCTRSGVSPAAAVQVGPQRQRPPSRLQQPLARA